MKKKEYYKAMEAFNECLLTAPNDSEIKKMYSEVAELCQKYGPSEEGYPKEIMNGLEELQKNSWVINNNIINQLILIVFNNYIHIIIKIKMKD